MGSFSFKKGGIEIISKAIINKDLTLKIDLFNKVQAATNIVWATAHARRPKISIAEHKSRGGKKGGYRVSDPNAEAGVPVKTGALQSSILKSVTRMGEKVQGKVYIDGPGKEYANRMEFGDSKVEARPYMRPALFLNGPTIKKIFGAYPKV